jgi:hypothetical protein
MPTKSKRANSKKQPKKKSTLNIVAREKARKKAEKAFLKRSAAAEREYRKKRKTLKSAGIYEPTAAKLTTSRKRTINKRWQQFKEFVTGDAYIFVPFPKKTKKARKGAKKLAEQNQLKATRRGVYIQKTPDMVSATMQYNKTEKSYRVVTKRIKKGETGEKEITEIIPIEPMGALEAEITRIENDAKGLGELGPKESIAFKVISHGEEGYSHKIFGSTGELRRYLEGRYQTNVAFKVGFFRTLTVVRTHNGSWFREHPIKRGNVYASRRSQYAKLRKERGG